MISRYELYFKNALEVKIQEFISEELDVHDFGFLSDNLSRLMTEAAFNILATTKDVNDYIEKNK